MNAASGKCDLIETALTPERICFLEEGGKMDALKKGVDLMASSSLVGSDKELMDAVLAREDLMSTGIGLGLAIPHVRLESVKDLTMAVVISLKGIADYESLDDKPVHLVFMMAAPAGHHSEYLRLLSSVTTRAKALNGTLLECSNAEEFYRLVVNGKEAEEGNT